MTVTNLENIGQLFDSICVFENINVPGRLVDDIVPDLIGKEHVALDEGLLDEFFALGADHVAHSLVKRVHLLRLEVADDGVDGG